jgi:hypothetical protein
VGVVADAHIARQVATVFEQDWQAAKKLATAN